MPPLNPTDKQKLEELISVLDACGAPKEILNARVRKIVAALGLPKDAIAEVKKAFTAKGFKVLLTAAGPSAVSLLPPPSTTADFETKRKDLHNYMKNDPKGSHLPESAIMQKVQDPYDLLAAYHDNDMSKAKRYRNSTDFASIHDSFDTIIRECGGANANHYPKRYYLELAQISQRLLNPNDDSIRKYRRYVQLQSLLGKYPFLGKLKSIPENIKLEPWFAKECLAKLQMCFNEDEAIAFYNYLADLTDTPYEKETTTVTVVCATCGTVHTFADLKTAQKEKCSCGLPLFRQCPTCGKVWPAVETYCPECKMNMDAIHDFPIHYQKALDALQAQDPVVARAEYSEAKLCNPKETEKLKNLDKKIKELEQTLGKPLAEIHSLINDKNINAANRAISAMRTKFPNVNLQALSASVSQELKWAAQQTENLAKVPATKAVEICLTVLTRVKDDPTALAELRKHKPLSPQNLKLSEDSGNRSCSISWTANPQDSGVTYTVIRKEGNLPPAHASDGEVVCQDIATCHTKDSELKPGITYYYSVFACRGGMESSPISNDRPILFLPPVSTPEASVVDGKCILSWRRMAGCKGVRILRNKKVLENCVTADSYIDDDVEDGDDNTYILQAVWQVGNSLRYSSPVEKNVVIESPPEPVQIQGSIHGGFCQINWTAPSKGNVILFVKLKANQTATQSMVYTMSQIRGMGQILGTSFSSAGNFSQQISGNTHMRVAAFLQFGSGDNAICCNTIYLTNMAGCVIDANKTCIENKQLKLFLSSVPEKATRIAYSISTDGFASVIDAPTLPTIDKNSWNMIKAASNGKQDLYITLFAVYEDGKHPVYSAPETCQVPAAGRATIKYEIKWGGWLKNSRDNATLMVNIINGTHLPAMTLYGRKSGRPIVGDINGALNGDKKAVCHIDSQPGSKVTVELKAAHFKGIPPNTELKLVLDEPGGTLFSIPEAKTGANIAP